MPEPSLFLVCALQPGQRPPGMILGSFDARGPTRPRVLKMARAAYRNALDKVAASPSAWASYDRIALVAVDCDLPPPPSGPKFIGRSFRVTAAWKDYDQVRSAYAADATRWNALAMLESKVLATIAPAETKSEKASATKPKAKPKPKAPIPPRAGRR